MHIVKRSSGVSPSLFQRYDVEWFRGAGDTIEKGELLARVDSRLGLGGVTFYYDLFSPVSGILQQILVPSAVGRDDIELALISTVPEPLDNIKIFYSYASEDELLRKELEKQLSILRRQGFVVEWHEENITAGVEKQKEADLYLS